MVHTLTNITIQMNLIKSIYAFELRQYLLPNKYKPNMTFNQQRIWDRFT